MCHNPRQGWKEEGGGRRGGAAAAEPGPAGEAEAGHGDAEHAKPGPPVNHRALGITYFVIAECSQERGGCKQEELPILVNSTGKKFMSKLLG